MEQLKLTYEKIIRKAHITLLGNLKKLSFPLYTYLWRKMLNHCTEHCMVIKTTWSFELILRLILEYINQVLSTSIKSVLTLLLTGWKRLLPRWFRWTFDSHNGRTQNSNWIGILGHRMWKRTSTRSLYEHPEICTVDG